MAAVFLRTGNNGLRWAIYAQHTKPKSFFFFFFPASPYMLGGAGRNSCAVRSPLVIARNGRRSGQAVRLMPAAPRQIESECLALSPPLRDRSQTRELYEKGKLQICNFASNAVRNRFENTVNYYHDGIFLICSLFPSSLHLMLHVGHVTNTEMFGPNTHV